MDHNKVIERIRLGSDEDLSFVYKKYRKEFLNWITRTYNCSLEDGKDIYQITILSFCESIESGKLTELKSSLKTYIFAIGKNKVQEHRRYQSKQETVLDEVKKEKDFLNENGSGAEEATFKLVEKCVENLGDPCRTLLQLYYYSKLSITEITEKLNYKNADTTKNLKYKCLQRLKKIFESQIENSKLYE